MRVQSDHIFIEGLRQRLRDPLPGLDAQMTMAPPVRGRDYVLPDNVRRSAVLVLIYPHRGYYHLAFMRRSDDGRVHSGQVSFPGGIREPEDISYTHTALREAHEELGIQPEKVEILGSMTELYIPPSNALVYPTVGFSSERPDFDPDPIEVAGVLEVELDHLLEEDIIGTHRVDVFGGNIIQAPGFTVNGGSLIWGATAMMIAEFNHLVREVLSPA